MRPCCKKSYYLGEEPYMEYKYIMHHGTKGQHWGVRRYQNPDGSLTPEGREHYRKAKSDAMNKYAGKGAGIGAKIGGGVGLASGIIGGLGAASIFATAGLATPVSILALSAVSSAASSAITSAGLGAAVGALYGRAEVGNGKKWVNSLAKQHHSR